jgi:hypothetical protein
VPFESTVEDAGEQGFELGGGFGLGTLQSAQVGPPGI